VAKQKTLLEEADAIAKELAEESPEPEPNGSDFEKLMAKDVVLKQEIQDILTKSGGRCDQLNIDQQAEYKIYLCAKIGVSPTLQPIDLIPTKNGLRPYLNKGAAELIRDTRKISIADIEVSEKNGMFVAVCKVRGLNGRIDCDMGACPLNGTEKSPMAPYNSLMKAVTKAKRRATLSMCGLGAIIEEAHPTEYNGNEVEQQVPQSSILLEEKEDEPESKRVFRDVVLSKIDVDELPESVWKYLIEQAMRLADTAHYGDAARWLQDKAVIVLVKDDNGNVVKATIKEVKNENRQG